MSSHITSVYVEGVHWRTTARPEDKAPGAVIVGAATLANYR